MANIHLTEAQVSRLFAKLERPEQRPQAPVRWHAWKPEEWPNHLGFDVGPVEVWKHTEAFRCFTDTKVLRVPYSLTTDPRKAAELCFKQGLSRAALDDLPEAEAQQKYMTTVPVIYPGAS